MYKKKKEGREEEEEERAVREGVRKEIEREEH